LNHQHILKGRISFSAKFEIPCCC